MVQARQMQPHGQQDADNGDARAVVDHAVQADPLAIVPRQIISRHEAQRHADEVITVFRRRALQHADHDLRGRRNEAEEHHRDKGHAQPVTAENAIPQQGAVGTQKVLHAGEWRRGLQSLRQMPGQQHQHQQCESRHQPEHCMPVEAHHQLSAHGGREHGHHHHDHHQRRDYGSGFAGIVNIAHDGSGHHQAYGAPSGLQYPPGDEQRNGGCDDTGDRTDNGDADAGHQNRFASIAVGQWAVGESRHCDGRHGQAERQLCHTGADGKAVLDDGYGRQENLHGNRSQSRDDSQ